MSHDAHSPGPVLNERPGPRVLLQTDSRIITPSLAKRVAEVVPTVAWSPSLSGFNLSEWDAIITGAATAELNVDRIKVSAYSDEERIEYSWRDRYPRHISILTVIEPADYQSSTSRSWLAFEPRTGANSAALPERALIAESGTVGRHLALPRVLPEAIERLVRRELIPAAEQRAFHRTFHLGREGEDAATNAEHIAVRPFLYGPNESVLAGSIERSEDSSLWFLPGDLPDILPWIIAALSEWHEKYPKRFPALPDWSNTDEWRTAEERAVAAEIESNEAWFEDQYRTFEANEKALVDQQDNLKTGAAFYERALLTDDGRVLEEAVGCALAELGFIVVDMDEIWPEGERKEDLRVVDPEVDGWIAIVEVKGFTGGVKETGYTSLGRWGQFYALEAQQMPSVSWYIANGFRKDDPSTRPDPYSGRADALDVVEDANDLVIDTRALFDLLRLVREEPGRAVTARKILRESKRLLVRCTAANLDGGQNDN